MANIQIGKYKRPGIFIEEFDQSVITSPAVAGLNNIVLGVSRKGPVNTPIRLTNVNDLETIFGQLDRNLERKGSFFHRTISKMLETVPVYAINLLMTDDNLDKIEYRSLSTSSDYSNDVLRDGSYRKFFDTTGFWKRDTESFINLTKPNTGYTERAFSLTNLSDKPLTTFVFKTQVSGFNRTLIEWYGTADKMPSYVNEQDWASDYMVDVVVVGGDWSNYQELAVDPRWSSYFNASGLRKEQIRNFANDRNVSLLAYYEGISLIPYFRDLNGKNIFIESTINNDTDRTGLYCAFNNDLIEEEFYNGKLDLLGNTIVGKNETSIDFLSYKETISEEISFTQVPLDLPGNVTGLFATAGYINQGPHAFGSTPTTEGIVANGERTAWFAEGSVYNVTLGATSGASSSVSAQYNVDPGAFAVINDTYVPISTTTSLTINASDYPVSSSTASYVATFVLDSSGEISSLTSLSPFTGNNYPVPTQDDIILGYVTISINSGLITTSTFTDVTVGTGGFIDLVHGASSDYYITETDPGNGGAIKIEFIGTNTQQSVTNYTQWRRFKMFNRLVSIIDNTNKNKIALDLGSNSASPYEKVSFENITISNIVTTTTSNKSFVLNTSLTNTQLSTDILNGHFVIWTLDNEFILGSDSMLTKTTIATSTEGVVGEYSNFYGKFYNGTINTKDFFYANRLYVDSNDSVNAILDTVSVIFIDGEDTLTPSYAGYDYIIFQSSNPSFVTEVDFQTFEQIQVPSSSLNGGSFTIDDVSDPSGLATALGYPGDFAYRVTQEVEYEVLLNVDKVNNFLKKHYLKMYLENDGDLSIQFVDELLTSAESVNTLSNNLFVVQSRKSNFKQTLEVEVPTSYEQVPNKILVKGDRYTEVKVGDFLEAYVDESTLEVGEVARKLTRILSKRAWSGDSSLTEISCDTRIKKYNYSGDLQTMRYLSVDNYASTYKAITFKGFKIRQASLPDGTEDKQNEILNLVAKGTPMFKSVTNKEAIDFRYLIDSFGLGLTERSKQQLVDICGERLDVFGFINMPSLRQFKNSSSPSFVDTDGVLSTEFISLGGNPESNPAFLYSFGDGSGTTCTGYFTPYLTVNDNGRPLEMPPASYVATTYMRKHISNITSITPWTIAAGVTNGRVTNIAGLEMDFTPSDIEFLNGAQMNPIVYKKNRGYAIETENTAQTLYKSALSIIHAREVLIELERELSQMLLDYQWKFNTPEIRAEIKLRADVICETYVNRNGLYNYFNKIDDENNTSDIIDNQMGVLDTYVEIIRGMGIIVNNITILRTGAISSGGFINS